MSISVLPECVYMNHMCGRCLQGPEEDVVSPETVVVNARKPPCGCWELNPGT